MANACDFALGKLHGVGAADLVHVHTGHRHVFDDSIAFRETRLRNLIAQLQSIPPGTEARTCKGLHWRAIVNAFDIWLWEASRSSGGQ